jgi:hypothetical protein
MSIHQECTFSGRSHKPEFYIQLFYSTSQVPRNQEDIALLVCIISPTLRCQEPKWETETLLSMLFSDCSLGIYI